MLTEAFWKFVLVRLALLGSVGAMTPAERVKLVARLVAAHAANPHALLYCSFWHHVTSCSDPDWTRTLARIGQVGGPRAPRRGAGAEAARTWGACQCGRNMHVSVRCVQIGGISARALGTNSFWHHCGTCTPDQWTLTLDRIGQA